ncbi:hypothetical protein EBO15_00485 [Actinomadura harenae]|uniref:XRE family transcriptional regulator n=2 Tax=Actinomadura harenae TaxID=2483351 RepID=A0A3M2MFQ0_9ACTN|nr:hypothetical protein EBO15_00485 [Actinomadura harenae]
MAVMLRNAADGEAQALLPSIATLQRYVRGYEAGEHHPGDLYASLYCRVFGLDHAVLFGTCQLEPPPSQPTEHDAANLTAWLTTTNVSEDGLVHLAEAAASLADHHTQHPPAELLTEVMALHGRTQRLLRSGRQRLRQTRELLSIDASLLAHACLLLGDVEQDTSAVAFGKASDLCTREAEASPARTLSALAKTARWTGRFAESADFAAHGFVCSAPPSTRILLAYQEANAAALMGNAERARQAVNRATALAATAPEHPGSSAWSCPVPRQAVYAISVAYRTGDPDAALRAVEMADAASAPQPPSSARTTWAQIRIGAGIAHVMKGSLDAAASEVAPVFTLAPEFRISTVTRYLTQLDRRLHERRFRRSAEAAHLRESIRDFNAAAFPPLPQEHP